MVINENRQDIKDFSCIFSVIGKKDAAGVVKRMPLFFLEFPSEKFTANN